jgi:cobalt/nickel transport system permease protein/cobalt/nickel transport protein
MTRRPSTRTVVLVGLLVALALAGVLSYSASAHPDGLEYVAGKVGFGSTEQQHASEASPFAGYTTRGLSDDRLSGGLAGIVGVLLVALLGGGLFRLLRRRQPSDRDRGED